MLLKRRSPKSKKNTKQFPKSECKCCTGGQVKNKLCRLELLSFGSSLTGIRKCRPLNYNFHLSNMIGIFLLLNRSDRQHVLMCIQYNY